MYGREGTEEITVAMVTVHSGAGGDCEGCCCKGDRYHGSSDGHFLWKVNSNISSTRAVYTEHVTLPCRRYALCL